MSKKFVWGGFFIGSTIGGYIPSLWGGEMLSITGLLLSFVGGVAGIVLGFRIGRSM